MPGKIYENSTVNSQLALTEEYVSEWIYAIAERKNMRPEYHRMLEAAEQQRKRMSDCCDYIWRNPEIGYKEWKTTHYLEDAFRALGYKIDAPGDIPGFTAQYDTGRPGPCVAIMGELDALLCAGHPDADPETGAVHACGHLIQTSMMLGVAAALKENPALTEDLCGKIRFIAVPAEETIDLAFRQNLVDKGIISYVAGKIEFLRRGYFDGVDMAMMFHATTEENGLFKMTLGGDGCITKHFEYIGRAAHAGGAPHLGINALYAASVGLAACNALRETFQEKDYIRYHPIITQAGTAANAIPERALLDTYVRAASFDVMMDTNRKINRAIGASAAALGAHVEITDNPGNFPLHCDERMTKGVEKIIDDIFGAGQYIIDSWSTQSTDAGDISSLMPVIQHHCMGAVGTQHGADFYIQDKTKALVNPCAVLLCMMQKMSFLITNHYLAAGRNILHALNAYDATENWLLTRETTS